MIYPPLVLIDSGILTAYYSGTDNYHNEFLLDIAKELYECVPLLPQDFTRIAELNAQYADLPGDFADLSLISISERLNIAAIATLDGDFDIYRRYRKQPFERIFIPQQ